MQHARNIEAQARAAGTRLMYGRSSRHDSERARSSQINVNGPDLLKMATECATEEVLEEVQPLGRWKRQANGARRVAGEPLQLASPVARRADALTLLPIFPAPA